MLNATKATTRLLTAVALMALPALVSAQNYYDDDIYYNPSKQPKVEPVAKNNSRSTVTQITYADYPAADTYIVNTGSTRDVDEYNRRGQFLVSDTAAVEEATPDTYTNTRRIQRFHNTDIIETLGDDDYATYVITDPAQVNIYMNGGYDWPYYSGYSALYSPYYYRPWQWGYYSPYWSLSWSILDPWYWGPSWSWGWGPSWAWGPSWCPGWGPSWYPGPGPSYGPGPGNMAWRPSSAGASSTHAYAGAGASANRNGNYRPVSVASANRVSGNNAASRPNSSGRPGNSGYGNGSYNNGNHNYGTGASNPNRVGAPSHGQSNQSQSISGGSGSRGRNNSGSVATPSTNRQSQQGTRPSSTPSNSKQSSAPARTNSQSSGGSYNRSSSGSGSSRSGSSIGSGSRSSGGSSGGRSSGGGGGGRGRR